MSIRQIHPSSYPVSPLCHPSSQIIDTYTKFTTCPLLKGFTLCSSELWAQLTGIQYRKMWTTLHRDSTWNGSMVRCPRTPKFVTFPIFMFGVNRARSLTMYTSLHNCHVIPSTSPSVRQCDSAGQRKWTLEENRCCWTSCATSFSAELGKQVDFPFFSHLMLKHLQIGVPTGTILPLAGFSYSYCKHISLPITAVLFLQSRVLPSPALVHCRQAMERSNRYEFLMFFWYWANYILF
jgi:hypothetical protein